MKRVFTLAVALVLTGFTGLFAQSSLVGQAPAKIQNARVANQPVVKIQTQRADTDSIDAMILLIDAASALGCGVDSTPVAITFKNVGIDTIFTIDVAFIANNDTITETINDTIVQNDTVAHTFATMAGFNINGFHSIVAYVSLAGDTFNTGDTIVMDSISYLMANDLSAPLVNTFENDSANAGWTVEDTDSSGTSWVLNDASAPAATPGNASILTGGVQVNDWFFSPCLDLDSSKLYQVTYSFRAASNTPESMSVAFGNGANSEAMNTTIVDSSFSGLGYRRLSRTFTVDSSGLFNIGFQASSGEGSGGIFLDDIVIEEIILSEFDVRMTGSDVEYGQLPIVQGPIVLGAKIENFGKNAITNVKVDFVLNYLGGEVHSESVTIPSMVAGEKVLVEMEEGYEPDESLLGEHQIVFTVSMDEADFNENNNTLSQLFLVTDTTLGRDNGNIPGSSLGIGPNSTGVLGQLFEVAAPDTLTSVEFVLINPTLGDFLSVDIYEYNGFVPNRVIASSETLEVEAAGSQTFIIPLRNRSVRLDTGKIYYLGLNENSPNITLATTTSYYTPKTGYVFFQGRWTTNDDEGFEVNFLLRANFGVPFDNTVGIDDAGYLNQFVSIYPNPAKEKMVIDFRLEQATDAKITVTNVIGKTVYSEIHNNLLAESVYLDLSNQNPGVYLVNIEAGGKRMTKKIVVTQ
ncbi:MAG: hypothetical protein ACJATA_000289 [Sphingobacteriales bacterium]|jgi:hypothetical protein